MKFEKWHGIGNDFILIDERELEVDGAAVSLDPSDGRPRIDDEYAIALCDRHRGIGADGVLVCGPSDTADARMLIHNADGSMAEMCGNGIRVAAQYMVKHQMVTVASSGQFAIETAGGIMRPTLTEQSRVAVEMGPIVDAGTHTLRFESGEVSGREIHVGNPHFVIKGDPDTAPVTTDGPILEHHPHFPNRSNIEWFDTRDDHGNSHADMRVWERGVGETLGCGTGACAVAYSAHIDQGLAYPITVHLSGGALEITVRDGRATMVGPTQYVASGTFAWADIATITQAASVPQPATTVGEQR